MENIFFCSIIFIALLSGYSFNNHEYIEKKTFVKHFDKTNSKLFKDCKQDFDCKLQFIKSGCGYIKSINKANSDEIIEEFLNIEKKLTKGTLFKCIGVPDIKTLNAVCKKNICAVETKK